MPQLLDDYYRDWQAAALDLKIKDYLYLEDIHRGITGPRDEEEARLYEWFRTERPAREVGDQDPYPPPVATNPLARALRRWRR